MDCRVLLSGVGGQGTILAAHVLADVALASGLDVKVSEIHGMAQRGGSVTTVVTFGETVESMVCGAGEADIVVSFDKLEALRTIDALKEGGTLIVNDEVIKPASVLTGKMPLPSDIDDHLSRLGAVMVPAEAEAREAGSPKTKNIVLLGVLSAALDFPEADWTHAIERSVPPATIEMNRRAFALGRSFMAEHGGALGSRGGQR